MNIKEAKIQISNAVKAYFTKDEFGNYIIPVERQRPIFMMGPPGVGKTAIMEQIAQELDIGLISYSMTHHTRQSALGLPFIEKKTFGGKEYNVSEYTMSEIIASVYDVIEKTGKKEGILFLDEINCVSETLAPAMLQFLQYKIFGCHKVPDGWIVVTAGNPPEYNNSVREFDIVTWDRLKRIDVEPNYDVWKEYAYEIGIHPSITTYLDIKKSDFYKIETTIDGKSFVTARGWSDLSDMIKLYELNDIKVDLSLIAQYLQNKKIAKEYSIYYDLFNKYKSDYQIDNILAGKVSDNIKKRAVEAKFDERLSLLGLILDAISSNIKSEIRFEMALKEFLGKIQILKTSLSDKNKSFNEIIEGIIDSIKNTIKIEKEASTLSGEKKYVYNKTITLLNNLKDEVKKANAINTADILKIVKTFINSNAKLIMTNSNNAKQQLTNAFNFLGEVYSDGQEMLIFVTELTLNKYTVNFISNYGCPEYFKYNKELLFTERQNEIDAQIKLLDL